MNRQVSQLIKPLRGLSRVRMSVFAGLTAVVGIVVVVAIFAAGTFSAFEPENGTLSGGATVVTASGASGGHAVQFGVGATPTPTPTPTPAPTPTATPVGGGPTGWPNASNVGLLVSTTRTMGGVGIDDPSWFSSNGFSGAGTQANPYLVDRVTFTSKVTLGCGCGGSALGGKYVKFTNSRFYGDGSNPTPDDSRVLFIQDDGPFVTVQDSTLGPNTPILASGGTAYGSDKAILSYVPFTAVRNNIYGANVLIGFEIESNEGTTLIQDNFLHDIWSCCSDHTDILNGNFRASHINIQHNYLDGIRVGNSYVVNGIGIYNDNGGCEGCATITDWTINNNYFDRSQTMILATNSTTKFTNPFVVTNNTFIANHATSVFVGRTPSVQSGNVNQNGSALSL
ncbi:MAG TPA: hypothetical protein VMT30_00745 [Candidatus Saccharimonadia bacterium]|nr:hypothetical protein [Candidatus Saccharimonadia bacterium]